VLQTLYFNVGSIKSGDDAENTIDLSLTTISQIRAKGHATKNGLDPRLVDDTDVGSVARDLTMALPAVDGVTDFFSPVRYRGAMRDNNWLFGWGWSHEIGLLTTSNVDRPRVSLSVSGAAVSVSFNADMDETTGSDEVLYIVERSTDGKFWVPVGAVQDGSTADAGFKVLADSDSDAGEITVTDSNYTYTGAVVHYRVIPQ